MGQNVHCTYISEKINKIRWRPNPLSDPTSFLTASWDNDVNHLRLWEIKSKAFEENMDINPCEIHTIPFTGDVTELKFINSDKFLASSSHGSLCMFKISTDENGAIILSEEVTWGKLHKFENFVSSCTSFAVYDSDIASVGEDGRINLLTIRSPEFHKTIEEADSCTMNCCIFLKYNQLLTSNIQGQMKIWDLRSNDCKPESNFMLSSDGFVSATCLAYHPTQRHIVIAGDEHGTITIWDLRQNSFPINIISSHMDSVSEVHFHPDKPEQLFSCSAAGEIFHWLGIKQNSTEFEQEPWYLTSTSTNKYDIFTLMPQLPVPVNSIDLNRDMLLCGSDNEAMYLIDSINVYN